MKTKKFDLVSSLIAYENGELNDRGTLELFAELIKSGMVWTLQGSYGRTGSALIEDNWISKKGEINWQKVDENEI